MVTNLGANAESSWRGFSSFSRIFASTASRASRARWSAVRMISIETPAILMSICSAVTPLSEPATLKSMSP